MTDGITPQGEPNIPAEALPEVSLSELTDLCVDNQDYVNHIMELLPNYINRYCKPRPYSMVKKWYLEKAIYGWTFHHLYHG